MTKIIKDRVADLRPQAEEKSIQLILNDEIQLLRSRRRSKARPSTN